MSQPLLRSRVRQGLLKVEEYHALARSLFYGKGGQIGARETRDHFNSCNCTTLLAACIIYWQAKEMSNAVRRGDPEADGIDVSLLQHVSPIEWDNVVIYGRYHLNRSKIRRFKKSNSSTQLSL